MQGSRLDFMKRKEARHTAARESGRKGRTAARAGRRTSDGGRRRGVTWDGII